MRYIDLVEVNYLDGSGNWQRHSIYDGMLQDEAEIFITGYVQAIEVLLRDGYDGNADALMSVDLSDVASCDMQIPVLAQLSSRERIDQEEFVIVQLYPNPVKDRLSINWQAPLSSDTNLQFDIIDLGGMSFHEQDVDFTGPEHESQFDVSTLPPGTYFLRVVYRGQVQIKKFIVTP